MAESAGGCLIVSCGSAVDHRNIVRSSILMRELWLETAHSYHKDAKRQFVSKGHRLGHGAPFSFNCWFDFKSSDRIGEDAGSAHVLSKCFYQLYLMRLSTVV